MASKSQTKYMVTCALTVGVAIMMERHYHDKPGCERIRGLIAALNIKGNDALLSAHGELSRQEIDMIRKKVTMMQEAGLDDSKSFQTHIAGLIGIVTDRLIELPETSGKVQPLHNVLAVLENIHRYFEQRTRSERFDAQGFKMLRKFDELFNPATGDVRSF